MWKVCNSFQLNISQNLLWPLGQDNLLLHFQTFMDTSCALRSKPLTHPARNTVSLFPELILSRIPMTSLLFQDWVDVTLMVIHDSSTHLQYGASPIPISFHEVIWSPFKNVSGVNKKFAFQLEFPPIKPHYFTALFLNLEPQGKYILLLIINNSFRKVGTLFSWTQNSCIVYLYTTLLEIIFSSFLETSDNY
jgi:hypothetical protein